MQQPHQPGPASDDDPAVFSHIAHERRIGDYALSDEEHTLLVELVDQPAERLSELYADRISDLHVMEVPLGQGQMQRWYAADDPRSQAAVDQLMYLVGDVIDSHY